MEEAKIKAFRVQVPDLESGETVMDNITPACLCVTFVHANEGISTYSSTVQYKKDIVPVKALIGLAKTAKNATENAIIESMQYELAKFISTMSVGENAEIMNILKLLAEDEEEDEDD
nr:MAG TPA: hypothetical protein [Caudoviricetes sp.]